MDAFYDILATVEELRLWTLHFARETHREILHDDAVAACEEADDILDKVAFIVGQLLPVLHVLREVNLLSRPEDSHVLLVFGPDVWMLDGEDCETFFCLV